ncbi:hypothetical protein ACLOJK_026501 [Asimina triloba]
MADPPVSNKFVKHQQLVPFITSCHDHSQAGAEHPTDHSGIHHSNPNRPSRPHEPTSAATRSRANLGSHGQHSHPSYELNLGKTQPIARTQIAPGQCCLDAIREV